MESKYTLSQASATALLEQAPDRTLRGLWNVFTPNFSVVSVSQFHPVPRAVYSSVNQQILKIDDVDQNANAAGTDYLIASEHSCSKVQSCVEKMGIV